MEFMTYFSTISGLSALVVIITDWLNKIFKIEKGWIKQMNSWITSIVICLLGFLLQVGLFATFGPIGSWLGWVYAGLTGIGTGLVSNGIYDISGVKNILSIISEFINRIVKSKGETTE